MAATHQRSASPALCEQSPKRAKTGHNGAVSSSDSDSTSYFASGLLAPNTIHRLNNEYANSEPYKYCKVDKLFEDELLVAVKDEILAELSFTEKETDIYKVNQTGDLASLNYLSKDQISLLPNLLKLRDALYSPQFRAFVRAVTSCGALSGSKQDMSVNTYTKGCHLLNHDDVIGSRRVSYILYMPLPHYQGWQPEWGGALELYPTRTGSDGLPEPECVPSKCIPPTWDQFIFFEVQPGKSFHSVEEVVVGEAEDGRQRLSISGWFHAAQPGEEGYDPNEKWGEHKSSREQLASTSTIFHTYPSPAAPPMPSDPLSPDHISFLSEFLNPVYLQPRTMHSLASRFAEDARRASRRTPPAGRREAVLPRSAQSSPDGIVRGLQDELFPSAAFRAWLTTVAGVLPLSWAAEARRFRPGLDYTLATSEESEARLDVVLGLTPEVPIEVEEDEDEGRKRKRKAEKIQVNGWQSGEWGGWECYMAPHEEEDDPAVYRSGSKKSRAADKPEKSASGDAHSSPNGKANGKANGAAKAEISDHSDESEDEEDDGTLLTVQPGFNRLLLVLRDEKVMRFVKYVSAAAEGSRWDVCGEYEVGMLEEDDEE
ncbi:hypothetical protein PHLGIDRAFT_29143 [Phlebiopsis gigantea 11061_1 CR5-6]|uniref:uS12 prolyl 3,4-dihydroxylase n=1 Tax=Phlebiopsis gigantea (strain 11061_1 CR5-6) TaxID=745531 RepID=A0A0C3S1T9_PHLG1|nr:hypothetical protein PHLGIDRAFT_29143 [Phlebiopsis gigantea 11061_1 CR5-6]